MSAAELIERLRAHRVTWGMHEELVPDELCIEAADALEAHATRIASLEARVAAYEDALRRLVDPAPAVSHKIPAWAFGIVSAALKEGAQHDRD